MNERLITMKILALRSYMNIMLKLMLLTVLAFQIIAFNATDSFADNKSALLDTHGGIIADTAENRINSVVNISSTKVIKAPQGKQYHPFFSDPFFKHFFGQGFFNIPRERREKSLGSGVIVSKDGLVLTNNHVVENAQEILITMADEREMEAEIVGTDPKSDVAVLQLKGDLKGIEPIPIGDSTKLRLGEIVLAMGNPFGLEHTVTMGIVSAKGRANVGITDYEDFIQTDAAINPGNSGGALINLKGELVGINTAIISRSGGYQGIGFAIPSNMAQSIMNSLVKHGKVIRGWLGVSIQDLDQGLAKAMGLDQTRGVLVSEVVEDSPAQKAGIKRGDVILKINDKQINSTGQLRSTVASFGAGTKVSVDYIRNKKRKNSTVELGQLPENLAEHSFFEKDYGALSGITIAPLNDENKAKFQIPDQVNQGVVIADIKDGSPAQMANLRPGDIILEINRMEVNSVDDFREAYKRLPNEDTLLLIYRNGRAYYLVLKK
jgi:serine protease Do